MYLEQFGMDVDTVLLVGKVAHFLLGVMGVVTNGVVIGFGVGLPSVKGKEYRVFVVNQALMGALYALCIGVLQPVLKEQLCVPIAFLMMVFAAGGLYATLLVVFNRYIRICR